MSGDCASRGHGFPGLYCARCAIEKAAGAVAAAAAPGLEKATRALAEAIRAEGDRRVAEERKRAAGIARAECHCCEETCLRCGCASCRIAAAIEAGEP